MPSPKLKVRFEHEGTLGRYFVQSECSAREYLVDLSFYRGVGKCGCQNFAYKREPTLCRLPPSKWRQSGDTYRCKHIIAAILFEGILLCEARLAVTAEALSHRHEHEF